ncbi:MAG: cytochrome c peroxidase [Bradymonadia bacterium]|jgi:cytochrome c peroxidase
MHRAVDRVTSGRAHVYAVAALIAATLGLPACHSGSGDVCAPETTPWVSPSYAHSPPAPSDSPLTEESVSLGETLFFDTRLSGSGQTSCASCHDPERAFTDGRARSIADDGALTRRSAPSLVDVAYATTLTWANPLLRTLEDHALIPLFGEAPREMASGELRGDLMGRLQDDPALVSAFAVAYPCDAEPVTLARVADALASYQRTLLSGRSRYDQHLAGARDTLSAGELRGLALLESDRLACTSCHLDFGRGAAREFHNTGVHTLAEYATQDSGLFEHTYEPAHRGQFAVPTLRNITLTAPYMHDGSIPTLDAVLSHYAEPGSERTDALPGFALTEQERADVLSFFHTLTEPLPSAQPQSATPIAASLADAP